MAARTSEDDCMTCFYEGLAIDEPPCKGCVLFGEWDSKLKPAEVEEMLTVPSSLRSYC